MFDVGSVIVLLEGDVGIGMVGMNSVCKCMGNILVGILVFLMNVLDKLLFKVYCDIDIVMMLDGLLVVMVYVNNCLLDINVWVMIFYEFVVWLGMELKLD